MLVPLLLPPQAWQRKHNVPTIKMRIRIGKLAFLDLQQWNSKSPAVRFQQLSGRSGRLPWQSDPASRRAWHDRCYILSVEQLKDFARCLTQSRIFLSGHVATAMGYWRPLMSSAVAWLHSANRPWNRASS